MPADWTAALLAIAGLLAVLAGLALLMRGAGARGRRSAVTVLAVGGAGLFLGGAAFGAPSMHVAEGTAATTVARPAPASPSAAPSTAAPRSEAVLATTALAALTVKGPSPMTGYARVAQFGRPWEDVDRNGCDTRDDVLRRDLTGIPSRTCRVRSGILHDPYTGTSIAFVRGNRTSEAVQIDHVVSLGDAWRTGAQRLTAAQRLALANDPLNLFAVDGPTNTAKSDGDAATWLPPAKAFRCTYVAHQIAVKRAYGLWVTRAEGAAMARVLARCPEQALPAPSAVTRAAAVPTAPATAPAAPSPAPATAVHPGAMCAPAGASGSTAAGTAMSCRTTPTDDRARWRRAA